MYISFNIFSMYLIIPIVVLILGIDPVAGQIRFESVSDGPKISTEQDARGAMWGDFNGDSRPDLWFGNHGTYPSIFLNQASGKFMDIARDTLSSDQAFVPHTHGGQWADFDNDGDSDLTVTMGDPAANRSCTYLFFNSFGRLHDKAAAYGLSECRGFHAHSSLWFDWDNDGNLDLFEVGTHTIGGPRLFHNTSAGFQEITSTVGLAPHGAEYIELADLTNDGKPELLFLTSFNIRASPSVKGIYDISQVPFVDIAGSLALSQVTFVNDVALADFDGDLDSDVFMVRSNRLGSGFIQINTNKIKGRLLASGAEKGIRFKSQGKVLFDLDIYGLSWGHINLDDIYIGTSGRHPSGRKFTLSTNEPSVVGLASHDPRADTGIYIGYDPARGEWTMLIASNRRWGETFDQVKALLTGEAVIQNLTPVGFELGAEALQDQIFMYHNGQLEDGTASAGLTSNTACVSAGVGDFDNDMDMDIYLSCAGAVSDVPNILYENQGEGRFLKVPLAGGAAGSPLGFGDTTIIADYDEDGFLDIFSSNNQTMHFVPQVRAELFRNTGNSNHWIEIDLEGVVSNRDGIGAKVYLTAAGTTQVRDQFGGMHRHAQDHQRIHFGLGSNAKLDRLKIHWPSGVVQELADIPADQLLHVIEPAAPSALGKPVYQAGIDEGVYLWKETAEGPYRLRISGASALTTYQVKLVSSEDLLAVAPYSLESDDRWQSTSHGFSLIASAGGGEDGVDFRVPPGAQVLVSVEKDGVANPRQLHVGAAGKALSPVGWIKAVADLPSRPALWEKGAWGLLIGQGTVSDTVEARWRSNATRHRARLSLIGAKPFRAAHPYSLESDDKYLAGSNTVSIQSWVNTWWADGVDVHVAGMTDIGIVYEQDGLFPPHRVNAATGRLGQANAYRLPR